MSHPETIYRLGQWIAAQQEGIIRLAWAGGELFLTISNGKIVSATGPDPMRLARLLGRRISEERDLMLSARNLSSHSRLEIDEAVGAVKQILQEDLSHWLRSPERTISLVDEKPEVGPDPNISFRHALIEMILTAEEDLYSQQILPDTMAPLKQGEFFLDQYPSLRLSEEADLVVARIDGRRSINEILSKSSLPADEVLRLLAALTAVGLLEISDPPPSSEIVEEKSSFPETELEITVPKYDAEKGSEPHRISPWLFIGIGLGILALLILSWVFFFKPAPEKEKTGINGHWGIVVDLACEPEDYRRVIQTANQRSDVRAVESSGASDSGEPCWRLVWGDFPSREEALKSLKKIPSAILHKGFDAHVIQAPPVSSESLKP